MKNNKAKALLIPIAAFAVTATGVSAFDSKVLERAGLTETEISAFEEAHELRKEGDKEAARDVLVEAGIDLRTMEKVREAMHEKREESKNQIDEAVESGDYEDFLEAIKDSPLADIINTEADFEQFVEAHELREEGQYKEAREIMEELGLEKGGVFRGHKIGHDMSEHAKKYGRTNGFVHKHNAD